MDEIEQSAYDYTKSIDDDNRVIVGVNKFQVDSEPEPNVFPIDPSLAVGQIARLKKFKENRDQAKVQSLLNEVKEAAKGSTNLLIPMKEALRAHATLGEVSDALREVFGTYQPGR
jgi:methylmalonyl-CoA mutase N-terminal domain/subunit